VKEFQHPPTAHGHRSASAAHATPKASVSPASGASTGPSPGAPATPGASPSARAATAPATGHDWSSWQALARQTTVTLEAPTAWSSGLGYDTSGVPFRAYSVETPDKRHARAAIAVGTVSGGTWGATEYWGVQALAWKDPPAIANPNATRSIGGRTYLLFYQNSNLHMVAWQENGATYWVINTLDNLLSNPLMMRLAESCRPVGR
jgi:hypothetical protein